MKMISRRQTPEGKMRRRSQRLKNKRFGPVEDPDIALNTTENISFTHTPDLTSDPSQVCEPNAAVGEDTIVDSVPPLAVSPYKPSINSASTDIEHVSDIESNQHDSGEEAPDDVTLVEGRITAIGTLKNEQDQVKRVRENTKEKRRKNHELYRKQKISKKSRVISKFPEKALEEVLMQMAEERVTEKAKKKLKRKHRTKIMTKPLPSEVDAGPVQVVVLSDSQTMMGSVLVKDFRQEHFYGDRLKRLPALSIQARKYRNSPAKNFT